MRKTLVNAALAVGTVASAALAPVPAQALEVIQMAGTYDFGPKWEVSPGTQIYLTGNTCVRADVVDMSGIVQALASPSGDGSTLAIYARHLVMDGSFSGANGISRDTAVPGLSAPRGGHGSSLILSATGISLGPSTRVAAGSGGQGAHAAPMQASASDEVHGGDGGQGGAIVLDGPVTSLPAVPANSSSAGLYGGSGGRGGEARAPQQGVPDSLWAGTPGRPGGVLTTDTGAITRRPGGRLFLPTRYANSFAVTDNPCLEEVADTIEGQSDSACDGTDGTPEDTSGTDATTDGTDATTEGSSGLFGGVGPSGGDGTDGGDATGDAHGSDGTDGCWWGSGGDGGAATANGGAGSDGGAGGKGGSGTLVGGVGGSGGRGGDGGNAKDAYPGRPGCGGWLGPNGLPGDGEANGGQPGEGGEEGPAGDGSVFGGGPGTPGAPGTIGAAGVVHEPVGCNE